MFSKTIPYTDYDGTKKSSTHWFHLSRKGAIKDVSIADDFETVKRIIESEKHELTTREKQQMLDFIVKLCKMSYGLRSEDGSRFKQNDDVYEAFEESAVYDAFLVGLFDPDPAEAFRFILQAVPADIRQQIDAEVGEQTSPDSVPVEPTAAAPGAPVRDVSESMSPEEFEKFRAWRETQVGH